jgi:2-keto-4-pentenoate hydratase
MECELAVRLARDLPPGPCSRAQAMAAAGDLLAAIEVVDNRYGDLKELGTPTLIADQVFHGAAVLGPTASPGPGQADWRLLDIPALTGRILIDGQERDSGLGAELLGDPLNCLAWLAASPVAAAFGGLKGGQVILLGSVTPPIWLTGPAHVRVEFSPLPAVEMLLV